MRGNDISRRDASLAKRNTLFQAYGNIPQVIMIDLARVGSVLNQPAYRQDDSDGPLSGAPMASSSEGGFDAYSCTLNTLHAARVDQMLTPDGMVKIITAEAPQTFIPPEDLETPGAVQGIVRAKRVIEHRTAGGPSQTIQEYREVCPCELFDCVAEEGAVELSRGCAPPPSPPPHSPPPPPHCLLME